MSKRLYIFDLDGTLIEEFIRTEECAKCHGSGDFFDRACDECRGKGRTFGEVLPYERVEWLPGRLDELTRLNLAGAHVSIATNQGGISLGHQSMEEVQEKVGRVLWEMIAHCGAGSRSAFFAPFHPDAKHPTGDRRDRKPEPGMLRKAMVMHGVSAAETCFVGDLATDRDAALRAQVDFHWAADFFDLAPLRRSS